MEISIFSFNLKTEFHKKKINAKFCIELSIWNTCYKYSLLFVTFIFIDGLFFPIAGNRKAMKGLGIGIALLFFASFTAIHVMSGYAVITFQKAGTSVDANVCSIILAIALMFGAFMTASFADKLGRRKLNLISFFGAAMGLLLTALYIFLSSRGYNLSSLSWVPVVSI